MNPRHVAPERVTAVTYRQSVRSLTIAARARTDEDGYPVSGDMLTAIRKTTPYRLKRRRERYARIEKATA